MGRKEQRSAAQRCAAWLRCRPGCVGTFQQDELRLRLVAVLDCSLRWTWTWTWPSQLCPSNSDRPQQNGRR